MHSKNSVNKNWQLKATYVEVSQLLLLLLFSEITTNPPVPSLSRFTTSNCAIFSCPNTPR